MSPVKDVEASKREKSPRQEVVAVKHKSPTKELVPVGDDSKGNSIFSGFVTFKFQWHFFLKILPIFAEKVWKASLIFFFQQENISLLGLMYANILNKSFVKLAILQTTGLRCLLHFMKEINFSFDSKVICHENSGIKLLPPKCLKVCISHV